ncbi:MAG: FimV/HubP family polar landmark protein [Pseudomonadota bacterium]|nr:FimV/HubP family polar landmark protein [Pseudomonadota bacterium]
MKSEVKFKPRFVFALKAVVVNLALFWGQVSFAVGMGSITTTSFLNQNFEARIQLNDGDELDLEKISVRLAKSGDFERAGIPFSSTLFKLKFSIEEEFLRQPYVRVWSDVPINDPYLHFVVELALESSSISKEFTVLVDPASFFDQAVSSSQTRKQTGPVTTIGPIGRRDTLWPLAEKYRPGDEFSVEQMMVALVQKNPSSFGRSNVNILLQGSTLVVPSKEEISRSSKGEAREEVRRQYRVWKESKQILETFGENESPVENKARLELLAPNSQSMVDTKASVLLEEEVVVQAIQNAELEERLKDSEQVIALLRRQSDSQRGEIEALKDRIEELSDPTKKTLTEFDSNRDVENLSPRNYFWWILLGFSPIVLATFFFVRKKSKAAINPLGSTTISGVQKSSHGNGSLEKKSVVDPLSEPPKIPVSDNRDEPSTTRDKKDPLAGLNVYLAYERYEEAKKIIRRAITDMPGDLTYRIKLLEVLVAMNNSDEFRKEALLIKDVVGTEGAEWANILALWDEFEDRDALINTPGSGAPESFNQESAEVDLTVTESDVSDLGDVGGKESESFEIDLSIEEEFSDSDEGKSSGLSITPVDKKSE